jgi:hypothetical protein
VLPNGAEVNDELSLSMEDPAKKDKTAAFKTMFDALLGVATGGLLGAELGIEFGVELVVELVEIDGELPRIWAIREARELFPASACPFMLDPAWAG